MAQDGAPRMFHSSELAPVTIPREARNPMNALMHSAPVVHGPAVCPRSRDILNDESQVDATGDGHFMQCATIRAPPSANSNKNNAEAAPSEPSSSTRGNFTQEKCHLLSGDAKSSGSDEVFFRRWPKIEARGCSAVMSLLL